MSRQETSDKLLTEANRGDVIVSLAESVEQNKYRITSKGRVWSQIVQYQANNGTQTIPYMLVVCGPG